MTMRGKYMAERAQGCGVVKRAREILSKARTADESRQAPAVVLPLELGFSIEQTAAIIRFLFSP